MIYLQGVTRIFRTGDSSVAALDDVSMEADLEKITVLYGPSGSGKTTLINIIGALDLPTVGSVCLNNVNLAVLSEFERDQLRRYQMGFVFQSVALIAAMSALENVEFALRIAGFDRSRRERRAKECLAIVGLKARMDHRPAELSGGEQQRVAIARGFAHRPLVLFADEPTAELDSQTGMQIIRVLRSLADEHGLTVIMSSHDQAIVDLADKKILLRNGRIIAENQAQT